MDDKNCRQLRISKICFVVQRTGEILEYIFRASMQGRRGMTYHDSYLPYIEGRLSETLNNCRFHSKFYW